MTREEAIKRLEDTFEGWNMWVMDNDSPASKMSKALGMAISALREQPRWISVEERLPEIGATVLTLDKFGHIHDRYMYRHQDGTALFTAEYLVTSKDVTHWMPLPEAPEEEKHES